MNPSQDCFFTEREVTIEANDNIFQKRITLYSSSWAKKPGVKANLTKIN